MGMNRVTSVDKPNFNESSAMVHERDPCREDFVGKTIVEVDFSACNIWRFRLRDEQGNETMIAIEAEVFSTPYGGIPVMQVCDPCGEFDESGRADRPDEDRR